MPHIIVKLWPGKTEEQKAQLAKGIVELGVKVLGKGEEAFSVAIEEIKQENWKEQVYTPEIVENSDKLYVKPGYKM